EREDYSAAVVFGGGGLRVGRRRGRLPEALREDEAEMGDSRTLTP
ncbi:hypothetical protein L195_g026715, partial [Trifolium pratense]